MFTDHKNTVNPRIEKMIEAIMEAAKGSNDAQVELSGDNDVYDSLAKAINLIINESRSEKNQAIACRHNLEKVNKELDQFAYIVSHDLKAPLRAISNLSEWIEEDLGPGISEDVKQNMNTLRGRVRRMEALINGVMSYSKSTRTKAEPVTLNLNQMVDDILHSLSVPEKFTIVRSNTLPSISGSKVWLEQIFSHLLSNAIKHHDKPEGKIEIAYKEAGDFHQFSIIDNGPGIPSEYQEKIFTIFQTLEARDKAENTGVGLSIAKKIIEEMGGKIWVESVKGEGASFIFTLPRT